jgi:rubrerythrin
MNIARTPVTQLLEMAIRAELDSEKTYSGLAERVKNPLLKEKFQVLAFEEGKHNVILRNLFAALYPNKQAEIPEKIDAALLPSVKVTPETSLAEILYQAMSAEKAAQNFYAGLARRVTASKKKILDYLSKVERSHYQMLYSEYTLALLFEDYAEQDIEKVVT